MSEPVAYLLTWTCYGTWLHGDPRGSVDDDHRTYGAPFLSRDPASQRRDHLRLRHVPVTLGKTPRQIVADTIADHCRHRGWDPFAVNVRSNHVHVVVAAGEVPPERVLSELKAWSTRRLREAGYATSTTRLWTRHGSTRYLWNDRSVESAVAYVCHGQDHP